MLREWKMNNCMKKPVLRDWLYCWLGYRKWMYHTHARIQRGMGGPDHLENHKFYRFQLKLAFGPHTPWKNLDPPPLKNDRPPLEPYKIIVFLKIIIGPLCKIVKGWCLRKRYMSVFSLSVEPGAPYPLPPPPPPPPQWQKFLDARMILP